MHEFLVMHSNIHWFLMPDNCSYIWGPSEREFWQRASRAGEATTDVAGTDEEGEWGQDGEGETGAGKERKNQVRDVLYFIICHIKSIRISNLPTNWAEGFNLSSVCGVQILNWRFWVGICHYHLWYFIMYFIVVSLFYQSSVDFKRKILCIKQ